MPTREERQEEARKHIGLVKGILATETQNAAATARLYKDGECRDHAPEPRFDSTAITIERIEASEAVCRAKGKACVLDFASYRYPGGGYARGAWAQEEALCAESNLYPVLELMKPTYYDENRASLCGELYTDRALYLEGIVFLRGGNMTQRDVIVCAAPHRERALENHRSVAECDLSLRNRIRQILGIAALNQVDTLVLGAFGCGSFGNDPVHVASLFKEWLEAHNGVFEKVVFAIPGGPNLDVFRSAFDMQPEKAATAPAISEAGAEEEDEEDWLPPTENGRWIFE